MKKLLKRLKIPLIHPDNRFLIYWDFIILIGALFIAIEIPLVIVFRLTEGLPLILLNWAITIIYIADIVINFHTSIYTKGEIISDRKFIAKQYLKKWFIIDLIAAFPFNLFIKSIRYFTSSRLLRLLRLARIIKLIRMSGIVQKANKSRVNPAIVRLFLLAFWVLLIAHIIACGWVFIKGLDPTLNYKTQYLRAYYWTITTLTTIGYGDITPSGNLQIIYVIIIELIGAGMYGLVIGNIANLIANIDIAKTQFKEKMKTINTFLKYRNIPDEMQDKVNKYFKYLWDTRGGYDESQILQDFPLPLKTSISLFLNKDIIEKVPIFKGASDEFIKEIILNLVSVVFTPGDNIVTAGEVGNDMYFISKGSVDVLSKDEKQCFATLSVGQFFGEIALLLKTPRTATIKTREFCDLYRLDKDTFDGILGRYPKFKKNINKLAEERKKEMETKLTNKKNNTSGSKKSKK